MRVVVIGAGLGGLSAAAHLVGSGHQVTVVEQDSSPGGRVRAHSGSGCRIDTGPTVLAMPEVLEATFAAAGRRMSDYVTLAPIDPLYRVVFPDGRCLTRYRDPHQTASEVAEVFGSSAGSAYEAFDQWANELCDLGLTSYFNVSGDGPRELRTWRTVLRLARRGGLRRLDRKVARFFDDRELRHLLTFPLPVTGVPSRRSPAMYAAINQLVTGGGLFSAVGGMNAVARGLERAVREMGATFHYRHRVSRILHAGQGAVTGVEVDGGDRIVADAVVCNADLPVGYRTLLGGVDAPRRVRRGDYSPSALVWVAGVRGHPPAEATDLNIHLGDDWLATHRQLVSRGRQMTHPTMVVSVPSLSDPTIVPAGHSAVCGLEPVPNLDGKIDWSAQRDQAIERLRNRLDQLGYPTGSITETAIDPLDWEARGLARGTPFGLAHTFRQFGPLRPGASDSRVPGLFFAGASTHPGAGIPMVLVSGRLAAEQVERYGRETAVMKW
ncbi:MAG: phytoene dehydrogenase [Ilumatobacter coccineus]|uniref:Phytoene dehydrogenase n=1 Tax=Ilumatobacter coccineus TaxID=467094 RepID=A0A2G6K9F9_9ACTN|nr:MAG: phytoene dehydrogenase [Ilumatobacter coccineus]